MIRRQKQIAVKKNYIHITQRYQQNIHLTVVAVSGVLDPLAEIRVGTTSVKDFEVRTREEEDNCSDRHSFDPRRSKAPIKKREIPRRSSKITEEGALDLRDTMPTVPII